MTDEEYDRILDEALVDAYGDYEQVEAFCAYIADEVTVPVNGSIAGIRITVTGFTPGGTRIVAHVRNNGKKYDIDLMSVEFPRRVLPVAAYQKWREGW